MACSAISFRLWGGLVPGNLDQLAALHECGVIGFKAFMSNSGIDEFERSDPATLKAGMRIVAGLPGMVVAVHAEDETLTAQLGEKARAEGRTDARAFAASRPIEAEVKAIRLALELAGETRCPLHVVHVSSAEGLAEITRAKQKGVKVTAETCPHYLVLTADAMERAGPLAKCAPPLRTGADQERLWAALKRGEVDTIGSDHSPCPPAMKATPTFAGAWGGISGVQHALPLVYGAAEARGVPFDTVASWLSTRPAEVFNLGSAFGKIEVGARADLCWLSRSPGALITQEELLYRHPQSPYVGLPLTWQVKQTWVRGKRVH
jgi:allantoinase